MRNMAYLGAFAVILLSLPASWWFAGRLRNDARTRQSEAHRAKVDRLAATAGFGSPPGAGPG
ncbi:hypothetical protein [Phreatobacter cathodiphilus]|uniref:Uncharacterized protein n=1 Tax=Phreatobacter cathodiphilus TaxID=1868589 RepID=A0A2S0NBP0_9HYPH|nr:hypothetical protein [Phreatobacter cathodiphilus]AVO45486.1 hypothetical protein C6569_10650 [Phreatobacter cathodiphilus]